MSTSIGSAEARAWLGRLAAHLRSQGRRRFGWWELPALVSGFRCRMTARIAGSVLAGVAFGGLVALLFGLLSGPAEAAGFGLVFGLLAAVLGGFALGAVGPPAQPLRLASGPAGPRTALLDSGVLDSGILDRRVGVGRAAGHPGRWRAILAVSAGALGVGAVLGWAPAAMLLITNGDPIVDTYLIGAPASALIVFLLGLHWVATSPAGKTVGRAPRVTFRQDRTVMLLFLGGYTVAPGIMVGTVGGLVAGVELGVAVGILAAVVGAILHGGVSLASTCWTWYHLSRWAAGRSDALPHHPLALLDQATRAGVLREVGAYFEFRHPLIRDYLADGPRPAGPESEPRR